MKLMGMPVHVHPLLQGLKKPRLQLRHNVPVSDSFRAEFDAWLLEMFGADECVIIMQNSLYLSPQQAVLLRGLIP